MPERGMPPILVLVSDGQPTDNFNSALERLVRMRWGAKTVRIAIAIGDDADIGVLQQFMGGDARENSAASRYQCARPCEVYSMGFDGSIDRSISPSKSTEGSTSDSHVPSRQLPSHPTTQLILLMSFDSRKSSWEVSNGQRWQVQ